LSDGTYTYSYDNEGNRTSRTNIATGEVTQYTWDYHNRLMSVITKDSSGTVTKSVGYTYDAYDRRIAKTIDPDGAGAAPVQTERMVYNGNNIALTFDGTGTQTHRYLFGPGVDQILADETSTSVNWALTDNQGTVRDVIDSQGQVLNHIVYDSFGKVKSETNPNVDFRYGYTGRERDEETGLDYYRTRYYDSLVGRFVSEDTIGFNGGDANLYRYVANSPLNLIDPNGTSWLNDADAALSDHGIDLYGAVNTLDKGVGGFASGATGGATDIVRQRIYGGGVNDNQHGALHDIASGLGDAASSVVGGAAAKGGSRLVRAGAGLLRNANKAADTYRKGESAYDIARGCGTPEDLQNLAGGLADRSGKHGGGNGHPPVSRLGPEHSPASGANAGDALNRKLRALEGAQQQSARERVLPDGRIRYYGRESPSKTPGPTRGASRVTEYNPKTGQVRSWHESYDQSGNVNRVHPKMIDGFPVNSQHYPPTGKELGR
jgi:RHS repeat-associated protein